MTSSKNNQNERNMTQRAGHTAACGVLLLTNLMAPVALAEDFLCYCKADVNCDWIVDGQDLSMLLGAWGAQDRALDLDGDCTVGGSDLSVLLGSWGALPPMPEWQDVSFDSEVVQFCANELSMSAVVDGFVSNDLYYGGTFGKVSVILDDAVYTSIEISGTTTMIMLGQTKVFFDGGSTEDAIYVNGDPYDTGSIMDGLGEDIERHGASIANWEEYSQAMMAMTMLHQCPEYAENMVAVQNAGAAGPGWFCKAAAIAAGAAITALATAGCAVLVGSCTVGTTVTFGGIAIPCAALIGLCAGGVFAGGASAYELALAYWGN